MELAKRFNIRILFILHFFMFFAIHLKQPLEGNIPKLMILAMYVIFVLVAITMKMHKWNIVGACIGLALLILTIFKLVIVFHFNSPFLYLFFVFFSLSLLDITKEDVTFIVRWSGIMYFVLALLLHYTPMRIISVYEVRELENKFLGTLINRFIGISGSPAGPDLIYTLVPIYTIFCISEKKLIDYINLFISGLVFIWASSISPVFAVFLALPILVMKKLRIPYFIACIFYWILLVIVYNRSSDTVKLVLNVLTTLRVQIWDKVLDGLSRENSIQEWLLGRKETVMYIHLYGKEDGNPHNLMLFFLEFTGVIGLFFIVVYLISRVSKMTNKFVLFFFFVLAFYSTTSPMAWTIIDSPLVVYMSFIVLNNGNLLFKYKDVDTDY